VLIAQTGPVTERLRVREIDDDEGRRLVRIVRRDSGSVVTWHHHAVTYRGRSMTSAGAPSRRCARLRSMGDHRLRAQIGAICVCGQALASFPGADLGISCGRS